SLSVELAIEISDEGFRAQAHDVGNITAVDVFIHRENFAKYEVKGKNTFFIDQKDFTDFIKTARASDELNINVEDNKSTFNLSLSSKGMTKRISLRLLDIPEFKFFEIAKRDFPSSCRMDAELLSEAAKATELGDEHVKLTISTKGLLFQSISTTRTAEANISFIENEQVESTKVNEEPHVSTYSQRFLKQIAKLGKAGEALSLGMGQNFPLRVIFDNIEGQNGYIAIVVAPRDADSE
ncbi:MAG: hypothetical protein OEY49_16360, partial [Candidatus Heimdallarchaeota archaeon]|nr:hypothetical protein [Candidatus Heimdallarchaeota archaeon]